MVTMMRMIPFASFPQAVEVLNKVFNFNVVVPENYLQSGIHVVGIASDLPYDEDALFPRQCAFAVLNGDFSGIWNVHEREIISEDPVSGEIIIVAFNQVEIPLIVGGKIVDEVSDWNIANSIFDMCRCNCIWKK